jgi:hypothetical protein
MRTGKDTAGFFGAFGKKKIGFGFLSGNDPKMIWVV